ncbi:MAG: hypothetical protein M1833_000011 [Piccolia ochrophora]|nr:MAG: hypothetical protein M1833_000011 [Piccolia ochrophora]
MSQGKSSKQLAEEAAGIKPSHSISIDMPIDDDARPPIIRHMSVTIESVSPMPFVADDEAIRSNPAYASPVAHHRRTRSTPRKVKETLNARSQYSSNDDDGPAQHRINQYIIKQELGRGSFGAVHLALDQHGAEYAVKEFSKSRLRKRAQSNILRRPHSKRWPGHLAAGVGFNTPLHRHSPVDIHNREQGKNPLYLIQEEIAIMKKLHHENLVGLIEVLDDPGEDSLYMVMEICKKGVIMKVGVGERADPYDEGCCRSFFRDLILGIEYLHAQGIVHRDIKPDNLLLTSDNVLKIVDFGVSEMFEKQSEMLIAKSAGSPAFLAPELCVVKHGNISGRAADIWSMGVTLYCLRFGRIPFEREGMLELYESIKNDGIDFDPDTETSFVEMMRRILDKDPAKRISMEDLREHPWVTQDGQEPMISVEENIAEPVEPPTEEEMDSAITHNFRHLLTVMRAVKKFKTLVHDKERPEIMDGIFGHHSSIVQPPLSIKGGYAHAPRQSRSVDVQNRHAVEQALVREGIHRDLEPRDIGDFLPTKKASAATGANDTAEAQEDGALVDGNQDVSHDFSPHGDAKDTPSQKHHHSTHHPGHDVGKGQAHDSAADAPMMLDIGPGDPDVGMADMVSESPPATDANIYETAYQQELERIRANQGRKATVYLTRRVEKLREKAEGKGLIKMSDEGDRPKVGWGKILEMTKEKAMPEAK